jgi:large-conductance mechanosensitive channel
MSSTIDYGMIGAIFATIAVIFSVIWLVLFTKALRMDTKLTKQEESEPPNKLEESTKADLQRLIAGMDDTKHRLDEVQTTLNEIRDLLKSTV